MRREEYELCNWILNNAGALKMPKCYDEQQRSVIKFLEEEREISLETFNAAVHNAIDTLLREQEK